MVMMRECGGACIVACGGLVPPFCDPSPLLLAMPTLDPSSPRTQHLPNPRTTQPCATTHPPHHQQKKRQQLFGRRSGFLALQASLASGVVDVCLIPEVPIDVDALVAHLRRLLDERGHAVVAVAEGAGQDLLFERERLVLFFGGPYVQRAHAACLDQSPHRRPNPPPLSLPPNPEQKTTPTAPDAAGEPRPADDAGNPLLRDVGAHLKALFKSGALGDADVKYIDPTHLVEATPSGAADHVLSKVLAQHAVDAAFAGFTGALAACVGGGSAVCVVRCTLCVWRAKGRGKRGRAPAARWRVRARFLTFRQHNTTTTDTTKPTTVDTKKQASPPASSTATSACCRGTS